MSSLFAYLFWQIDRYYFISLVFDVKESLSDYKIDIGIYISVDDNN